MFKFGFSAADDGDIEPDECIKDSRSNEGNALITKLLQRTKVAKCTVVNVSARSLPLEKSDDSISSFEPKLGFHRQEIVNLYSSIVDPIRYVIPQHTLSDDTTDLIPGVYEGGLKVWECSVDLCRFLADIIGSVMDGSNTTDQETAHFEFISQAVRRAISCGGSTLELGCGNGLPGCLILRENIRNTVTNQDISVEDNTTVVFTDFNDFVLQHATILNAQINVSGLHSNDGVVIDECITAKSLLKKAVFVGGDWMGLSSKISNDCHVGFDGKFDLILAAETTFSNCQLVTRMIKSYDTGNANIRDLIEVRLIRKGSEI
jgi:hypothetical protein